ncbi:hypothetical protein HMPREF1587_00598 [Bifidobacterium breve JCP7499]|nr:hypothetical protein HMPREF1587_00598 [Bifidobacterium breve JCP7499]
MVPYSSIHIDAIAVWRAGGGWVLISANTVLRYLNDTIWRCDDTAFVSVQ